MQTLIRKAVSGLVLATVVACGGVTTAPSSERGTSRTPLASDHFAITNVTVIPMTSPAVIRNATVVVRDGRIAAVGPASETRTPSGARVIDGTGKYLIPGLADMHAHLLSDGDEVPDSAGPGELGVMLANGVTTVRLMIGTPEQLALRREIARGGITGPNLWVASPQLTGRASENAIVVTTPEQARQAVATTVAAGYDFIKVTLFITPDVFDAIVAEAKVRGIGVVGHVDPPVGLERALRSGAQLEHLDSFFEAVLADTSPIRESVTQQGVFAGRNWASLDHIDNRKIDRLAGVAARSGTYFGPTLNIFNTAFAIGETDSAITTRPDWRFMPPQMRAGYMRARERYWSAQSLTSRTEARRRRYVEVRNRIVKAIHDSGGRIMASSDTPEWFHLYGWGLHRELQALVKAGLTPYDALRAATVTPAAFLGASDQWGTIARGRRADLLLLDADPLADISNTMRIRGVAIGGRWLGREELDALIERGPKP